MNNSDLSAARPSSSYASDRLLALSRCGMRHVDCANIAFSNGTGLNTILYSILLAYAHCLTNLLIVVPPPSPSLCRRETSSHLRLRSKLRGRLSRRVVDRLRARSANQHRQRKTLPRAYRAITAVTSMRGSAGINQVARRELGLKRSH